MYRIWVIMLLMITLAACEDRQQAADKSLCSDKAIAYAMTASMLRQRFPDSDLFIPHRSTATVQNLGNCRHEIIGEFRESIPGAASYDRSYIAVMRYQGNNYWGLESLEIN
jgi:hypothetical protein